MTYFAKSRDENGIQPTNREHLTAVAELAQRFGGEIGLPVCAWICGLLHDFGKYSRAFQKVLDGTASGIDHAVCAAVFLCAVVCPRSPSYRIVATVTMAHHSLLRSYDAIRPELSDLFHGRGSRLCSTGKQAALFGQTEYAAAWQAFLQDFPGFQFRALEKFPAGLQEETMLRTRLLFSCLVDADYTVSSGQALPPPDLLTPGPLLQRLYRHMEKLRSSSRADGALNHLRDQVFRLCGDAGDAAPGLFTLTAPTGVGKTLALLHFALRHCARYGKRRIILVLPFLTLTEQSQRVYSPLFPHILADHSQSRLSEEDRELAARWDAPFIITTSVRFFESLFCCHPGDCRKLHNIADSVILFDEAQSLPADLAAPTMKAAAALCRNYGCTMVFSTATQPDFAALPGLTGWDPREILPDTGQYYAVLRRTQVDWRLNVPTPLSRIAAEMARQGSVCAIVNLRRHARQLYEALCQSCPPDAQDSLFYLTADLCPAHRSAVIETIQARLQAHKPCRLVATQCMEAGVDLDFQAIYRALAPLEAIIQAAGRCNRNGNVPGGGRVTVFLPEDSGRLYPGESYQRGAEIVKLLWASGNLDIHDPESIAAYYRRLFSATQEKPALTAVIRSEDYAGVEQAYKLIRNHGVQVIVPYERKAQLFRAIARRARAEGLTAGLLRDAAPITVSCYDEELVRLHCEPVYPHRRPGDFPCGSDVYLLAAGHEGCYRGDIGFRPEDVKADDGLFLF